MEKNFQSPFVEARKSGIPPSMVDSDVALRIFEATLARSEEELHQVQTRCIQDRNPDPDHSNAAFTCRLLDGYSTGSR
mgnify:CR=1 FL=1